MKNSILLLFIILLYCSCNSGNNSYQTDKKADYMAGSDNFKDIIDIFYYRHLRLPTSAKDYTYMFYKSDSLNYFDYINLYRERNNHLNYLSFDEYESLIDSLYHTPDGRINSFLSWLYVFHQRPESFEIVFNQDSIGIKDLLTKNVISARNIETLISGFIKNKWSWIDSNVKVSEKEKLYNYLNVKVCSKDTIVIDFPDSLLNALQLTHNVFELGYPLFEDSVITMPKGKENDILLVLRYNKKDGITDLENNRISIGNTKSGQRLIQYLDSLIDMDSRIYFLQFCISPIGNTWESIRKGHE